MRKSYLLLILILGALIAFSVAFTACGDDDDDDDNDDDNDDDDNEGYPNVNGVSFGDCKNGAEGKGDDEGEYPERLLFSYEGGVLTVRHTNGVFNCCIESIGVTLEVFEGVISLYETENAPEPCFCVCPYDVSTQIGGLATGNYDVDIYVNDTLTISDEVTIP